MVVGVIGRVTDAFVDDLEACPLQPDVDPARRRVVVVATAAADVLAMDDRQPVGRLPDDREDRPAEIATVYEEAKCGQ